MQANIRNRRLALVLAASVCWLVPHPIRGDTVDASSTTMLIVRDQARAGTSYTIAPLYELLSISARDVRNPVVEDLQIVFSGWGAVAIGKNLVWYDIDRPTNRAFGDLDLAYVQGEVLKRSLQLRLGRQLVAGGVNGAYQVDGANALLRLPYGLGASAYVGSPVSQRFNDRVNEVTYNPNPGNFATGGRAYWTLPPWGELGASFLNVDDHGDPSRRQVGADLRLGPWRPVMLLANGAYDYYEDRWAEVNVVVQYQVVRKLLVTADYRHVEPDLLLARNSILAVFAVDRRNEVGGAFQYGPWKQITVDANYHFLKEQGGGDGHRIGARAVWRAQGNASLGAELNVQQAPQNGYVGGRAFGSGKLDRFTGTLDFQEYAFNNPINGPGSGHKNSFLGTGTLAYTLGKGFDALVSASAGATPYYESFFDVMAKLAYNQTYHLREVR